MNRLMFLNQQLDGGALVLRAGKGCLTVSELNTIAEGNRDVPSTTLSIAPNQRQTLPLLRCRDHVHQKGWAFLLLSSRNNNFSNRAQIGLVRRECKVDDAGRVTWSVQSQ